MKTTIRSILLLCTISISAQQNQQIQFSTSDGVTNSRSVNIPTHSNPGTSSYNKEIETYFADGVTRLTLNLNNIVQRSPVPGDIAYGPLTVAGALILVMLASFGRTADEIANLLGLSQSRSYYDSPLSVHKPISDLLNKIDTNEISSSSQSEVVSYATAIFVQQDFPIRQEFLKAINETYKSDIISLNFRKHGTKALDQINSWVSRHTNAKIPSLFHSPPPPETSAIIASVLYFKAAWEYPFFDGNTKPKPFYKNGRNQPSDRKVDMMANGGDFPYFKDRTANVEIMGFPYKGKRITMYVLLPQDSNQENLRALENRLTPEYIHQLVGSTRPTEAVITFPKLKIISSIDLKSVLQALNVQSLFNPQQSNLALMSSGAHSAGQYNPAVVQNSFVPNFPPKVSSNNQFTRVPITYQIQNPSERQDHGPNPSNVNQNFNSANPYISAGGGQINSPISGIPYNYSGYRQNNIANQNVNTFSGIQSNPTRPPNNVDYNYPTTKNTVNYPTQTTKSPLVDRLIFTRMDADCSSNSSLCDHSVTGTKFKQSHTNPLDELDKIRKSPNLVNPGIYADQIIHKVYIEITESGTEAAAATGISLNRSGGRVAFRLDVPFLFFIYHEETKVILFWGSVKNPTPSNG